MLKQRLSVVGNLELAKMYPVAVEGSFTQVVNVFWLEMDGDATSELAEPVKVINEEYKVSKEFL